MGGSAVVCSAGPVGRCHSRTAVATTTAAVAPAENHIHRDRGGRGMAGVPSLRGQGASTVRDVSGGSRRRGFPVQETVEGRTPGAVAARGTAAGHGRGARPGGRYRPPLFDHRGPYRGRRVTSRCESGPGKTTGGYAARSRASWLDEAIGAVRKRYEAEGRGGDQRKRGGSEEGQALVVPERGPGWFTVAARDGRVGGTGLESRRVSHSCAPRVNVAESATISQYVKYTGLYDEGEVPGELVDRIAGARYSVWIWAPCVSRRVEDFLPALEDAQARGVDVRVVTLPRWELKNDAMERFHDELLKRVPRVVFLANQHQKLVVVDDRTTFIGSMNVLSHNRYAGRREIMTVVESAAYARYVLTFERVDQLALPPLCDRCGRRMRMIALTKPKTRPTLHWQCRTGGSRSEFCWEKQFPLLAGTRNQRGPRR